MLDSPLTDPFSSRNHVFEPELQHPVPRPLPEWVDRSRYEIHRRQLAKYWLAASLVCVALFLMPFTDKLSYNLLPLGYLEWIGLGCLLVSALVAVTRALKIGRYKYIKRGVPIAARVVAIEKTPLAVSNGVPSTCCFAVMVELNHPETGELMRLLVKSYGFPAAKMNEYATSLRIGQYVTALYLPGRFLKSLKLCGFLELNPELDLVQRMGEPAKKARLWVEALKIAGLCLLVVAFFGMVYAISHYWPVEDSDPVILAAGLTACLVTAVLTFVLWTWRDRRRRRPKSGGLLEAAAARESLKAEEARVIKHHGLKVFMVKSLATLGFGFFGALFILGGLFAANALLDESKPEFRLVKIRDLTQTTYDFIYRTYQIEYEYRSPRDKKTFSTTYEHIMEFEYDLGLIELHRGRLGWAWVERILPVRPGQPGVEGDRQT